jgi:hypothetical protein
MPKNKSLKEYTPRPFNKWTNSSLLKLNNSMWGTFLKGMLDDETMSKEEKNKHIETMLEWFKMIDYNCKNNLLTIKKL